MKKLIGLGIAVAVIIALITTGTLAYFSDTETTTDNTFQAGTLDLAVNDDNPCDVEVFNFYDVKPCEDLEPFEVKFENVGQNPGVLYFCFGYVENDKPEDEEEWFEFSAYNDPSMEMSDDMFAALVYVAAVEYRYEWPGDPAGPYVGSWHDDLPNWLLMDDNSDGKVSLYELKLASPIPYDTSGDPLPASAFIIYKITFHLGDSLDLFEASGDIVLGVEDNRPQADGIDGIVTGILLQDTDPALVPVCP